MTRASDHDREVRAMTSSELLDHLEDLIHAEAPLDYDDEVLMPGGNAAFAAYYARPDVAGRLAALDEARAAIRRANGGAA